MIALKEKKTVAEAQFLDEAGDREAAVEAEPDPGPAGPSPLSSSHGGSFLLRGFASSSSSPSLNSIGTVRVCL